MNSIIDFYRFLLSPFLYVVELVSDWFSSRSSTAVDASSIEAANKKHDAHVNDLQKTLESEKQSVEGAHQDAAAASKEAQKTEEAQLATQSAKQLTDALSKEFKLNNEDLP